MDKPDPSSAATSASAPGPSGLTGRLLDRIERVGNRLPDPLTLFVLLAIAVPLISWLVAATGWSVTHPGTGEKIEAVNLLTAGNIQRMFTEAVNNFTGFKPLGVVLVAMIGIGVVERSGLIATCLKLMVRSVPAGLISAALVFAGVMSSLAADVGYVVLTPLGAVLFAGLGRHPLAGLAAAFAGVSGGFSANLLIAVVDPMLAGLTEEAAHLLQADYEVAATCNWWFMIASVFLVTTIGWWVTDRIVEPRLGAWRPQGSDEHIDGMREVSTREKRAAAWALAAFLATMGLVAALAVPENGVLRDEAGTLKPLIKSVVPIMLLGFFVPGLVYGIASGSIRSDRTVARMTADTMNTMGVYIVLAFAAAQFITFFGWSNLGKMLAIGGAELLQHAGFGGMPLILAFIVVAGVINLFIGSASAKWAIMAPVFVPMLMAMGFSPELTQVAYRIGDSVTNIITPLMPYFPIVVAFGQKYDPDLRLGTLIAAMLPYSVAFAIGWVILLSIWMMLGVPLGPQAPLEYDPKRIQPAPAVGMASPIGGTVPQREIDRTRVGS
ncbi:MAG: AbgT family transporter [Phycisphaerae bacterium]|nr:AbgT family transporter [Phycisphaerae bacterium]